ncbi:substrate-binding domain-containing protein [Amycolatopsis sp. NPDC051128]|uniref:substrate-binding domain-containing protein n=1 Tax=Amycolatopsis sp. NPDC051128 TaxID=3155412 RepID=UPI00343A102B
MEPEDLDATRIADVPRHDRFRSIGVVASTLGTLGSSRTLEAIATAAAAEGYATTLIPVEVVGRLDREAVDGVVVLVGDHEVNGREIELPDGVPVVVVDSRPRAGHPVVDTDQVQGAALATEHLLKLGHQTVWHIAGPMDSFAAKRREWSWRETLIRYDRDIPLAVVGDWSADSGYRLGQVLCRDPAVTAVFAANDQMALGLLRALREAGRSVPREVSVAGFDDMAEAACFWPPLTTVRQSFDELGHRAVRTLLDRIVSGSSDEVRALVPTTLVVRGSTAPPPW